MAEKNTEAEKFAKYWRLRKESRHNTRNVVEWKKDHSGMLPKSVWLDTLEAGGSYSCVEIIPYDPKTGVIYLKKRFDPTAEGAERGWEGKLHIPGVVELSAINGKDVLPKLLSKEVLKDSSKIDQTINNLRFLTQARYPEPERKTVADTLVLTLPIDPILLTGDFIPVTSKDIDKVIEQHRPLLTAYWNGIIPPIFDSRQK